MCRLYTQLLSRVSLFLEDPEISKWWEWTKNIYEAPDEDVVEIVPGRVCMDPNKSVGFEMTPDGLTLRNKTEVTCPSAIATHGVTKGIGNILVLIWSTGRWYYEVQLHTHRHFQIGWATPKFTPKAEVEQVPIKSQQPLLV